MIFYFVILEITCDPLYASLMTKSLKTRVLCRPLDKRKYLVIIQDNFLLILHRNICCDPLSEPSL